MKFLNKVKQSASMGLLKVRKYSPEILLAGGVILGVYGVVLACKKSIDIPKIKEEHEEELLGITQEAEEKNLVGTKYEKEAIVQHYIHCGWDYVKLYAAPGCVLSMSLMCFLSSYGILKKRNIGLMAAYGALDTAYKSLQDSVKDEFGEDKLEELKSKAFNKEQNDILEDDKDEESKKITHTTPEGLSPYAKCFDESSRFFDDDPNYNYVFLKSRLAIANNDLRHRGHVFLNDVYDYLDIPRTPAGAVVGWLDKGDGDGEIDFGLEKNTREARDFRAGLVNSIWLDFNVDGVIWDKI